MEPEETAGRQPKKGKKRRRAGAAEPVTPSGGLEDDQSRAKKACLSAVLYGENCEVTYSQLCELLKYAVLGKSRVPKPSWCRLLHQNHLNKVVVFILKGMSQLHFYRFYLEFGFLRKTFRHKFHLPPPSLNFLSDIVGMQNKKAAGDWPMVTEGSPNCENFILTKCNGSVTDCSPLFGLDCEMCLTSKGRELTRISLVAEGGYCVMDELVKPDDKILDYLTSFSGITKKILHPVTTKLKDVQAHLKELLPPDAVLVGHSLDVDLRALKMIHPYVIDTSLLYVGKQGRRFKLKFLAKVILGKDIQCPNMLGHDAIEDARTTLELAQYFLKYGPKKVAKLNLEAVACLQEVKTAAQQPRNMAGVFQHPETSVLECLESVGQKLLFLTQDKDELSSQNCRTIKCPSNKEVLEQARVEIPLFPFSIVQFSFDPFSFIPSEETKKRMMIKWMEMSTVYAGPFSKNCNLADLKKIFHSFGPVHSMTLVFETHRPHLCIQYEVLEAAQLAIESMNGTVVEGFCIKVQRPVTEFTLECDNLVKELEQDSENQGTLYIAGVNETFKVQLLQQSNLFLGLKAVILPKDAKSRKQKDYCFLKFKTFGNAEKALEILSGKNWNLKGRHALTPGHLQVWLKGLQLESVRPPRLQVVHPLLEKQTFQTPKVNHLKRLACRWSRKIEKLYYSLSPGTLCLILLPGTKSAFGSLSGLGMMKIKGEEECDTPGICE